ncbi:hypothetical protein BDR04DRAFT_680455 [Suillus decipiens]|nr:hypothetical protein BDR04DRAFT_680455 [Suillus decipiens]
MLNLLACSNKPRIGLLGSESDYTVSQKLGVRFLFYTLAGHSAQCVIIALTRAFLIPRQMRYTTATLSMTRRCGKRYTQIQVSTSIFVVTHSSLPRSLISHVTRLLSRWVCCLTDSMILPLNTTQYASELDSYVNTSVFKCSRTIYLANAFQRDRVYLP